ncbi:hypothetical protein Mpt1_c08980 [Candidatus Methanoplasma termitum]|uniref:Uncharacterized protein n=1 Tax=Candidatus Methanoplasma termitum TaxID=1577791 RepID=A0A0A7LCI1_9ARCH|nr:hypothetical protein [Candidatus Methanoplasma termitum]AIZ56774.1 hypothetical protein Mpt1_c08980 [Candidatus Methanoplasma termitum]MCL2333931.1 hypothetical protein [Candidatus Methanoplasma sp.]
MVNGFYEAMRHKGFSYNTTASLKKFKCPYCGFEFSMVYARTFACQGCSEAWKNCPKLRCAKCDTEFFITETPQIQNDIQQRVMAEHLTKIVTKYNEDNGLRPSR